ncbi:hypothetical protein MMC25_008319 [Agyrium rufum]|nr:hypothetical protein [Agyrium rufum]
MGPSSPSNRPPIYHQRTSSTLSRPRPNETHLHESSSPRHLTPPSFSKSALPRTSSRSSNSSIKPPQGSEAALSTSSAAATAIPPPSPTTPFQPFFTLINPTSNSSNGSNPTVHAHPTVHYIFSDDDPSPITNACLSLISPSSSPSPSTSVLPSQQQQPQKKKSKAPPANKPHLQQHRANRERYVLLSLSPNGKSITSAHSLTSGWQVLSADLRPAPTLDDLDNNDARATGQNASAARNTAQREEDEGEADKEEQLGMMLTIEGTEKTFSNGGFGGGVEGRGLGAEEDDTFGLEALVENFGKRMAELRRVVEGEKTDLTMVGLTAMRGALGRAEGDEEEGGGGSHLEVGVARNPQDADDHIEE